jgi:hypothetical protein
MTPKLLKALLLLLFLTGAQVQSSLAQTLDAAAQKTLSGIKPNPNAAPVGSVVASFLSEAQFQRLASNAWILADGRDISKTLYGRLTNTKNAPDLRGMFLRGQNNNRDDGNQNPELKQLGQYQADAVGRHAHSAPTASGRDGNRSGQQDAWYGAAGSTSTGECCAPETRPRNVTVNFFMRVN